MNSWNLLNGTLTERIRFDKIPRVPIYRNEGLYEKRKKFGKFSSAALAAAACNAAVSGAGAFPDRGMAGCLLGK